MGEGCSENWAVWAAVSHPGPSPWTLCPETAQLSLLGRAADKQGSLNSAFTCPPQCSAHRRVAQVTPRNPSLQSPRAPRSQGMPSELCCLRTWAALDARHMEHSPLLALHLDLILQRSSGGGPQRMTERENPSPGSRKGCRGRAWRFRACSRQPVTQCPSRGGEEPLGGTGLF